MTWAGVMLENWKQWEGQVVDGMSPLTTYLGGSSQSAVYLVDYKAGAERDQAAVKLIPADPQRAEAQLALWRRVAALSHPHLIRLFQMGRCDLDGVPLLYVVMELADENLSEILPQRPLTAEETGEMLPPLLDALAYVHEKGFAHAAIKPANILAAGDRLKISSDRLATIGVPNFSSTPTAYDPPEIGRGMITPAGAMSPAGDVWSLGMTLVEVLTQSIPAQEWGSAEGPPLPSGLPQPFLDIARHCLRNEVKRRWTLAQIAARMQLPATPDSLEETLKPRTAVGSQKSRKSGRYVLPVVAAALLAALFFGPQLFHHGAQVAPATVATPTPSPVQQVAPPATSESTGAHGNTETAPPSASAFQLNPPEPNARPQGDTSGPDAVVKRVLPEVSPSARDTIQGTIRVAIRVSVDSSGSVAAATFDYRGPSGYFADRVMRAAHQWKFAPAAGNVPGEWLLRFEITRTTITTFADPSDR
jgi:serine/threonine protein kinase